MEQYSNFVADSYYEPIENSEDDPNFSKLNFQRIWDRIFTIGNATIATSLSLFSIYLINLVSLAFVSHFENAAMMGGLGLGFVFSNCCVYILISSIDQGVNAIAAQAFGAKKNELVSASYHRGLFCLLVVMIPIFVLLLFSKNILMAFGIDEAVSEFAWNYIKSAYPSYIFYAVFDCTKSYLYAQKLFKPILYTQCFTTALHFFWGWLFITRLELGSSGAGIAKSIYEFSNMVIILGYIYMSDSCKENWVPIGKIQWRNKVLNWDGMKNFLSVVVPIAALLFLDMACYEVFAILAGQFGEDQLAVHVSIANSATLYYSFPLGVSVALMTFTANSMGENKPNAAKNYTFSAIILTLLITAGFVTLLWGFRSEWADLFSPNLQVKNLLLEILHIYLVFIFLDGVQVVLSGTMKGIGRQTIATVGLVVCYYLIALPLIYWFAFRLDWRVKGIWMGFLVGIFALFAMYLLVLAFTNFKKQANKIIENLRN